MIEFTVKGMTCEHCENAVRKALAEVPGVTRVLEVDREKNVAAIEGNPEMGALLEAVEEEGYEAKL